MCFQGSADDVPPDGVEADVAGTSASVSGTGSTGDDGGFFQGFFSDGIYTRADSSSLVVSKEGRYMVEDYDEHMRPVSRTEWDGAEKKSSVLWSYTGEGLYPCVKNETTGTRVTVTVCDTEGRETEVSEFSTENILLRKISREYTDDSGGNPRSVLTETFSPETGLSSTEKVVFSYNEEGAVRRKEIFIDGLRSKLIEYETADDWTETVYYKDEAVFTDKYEDGMRVTGR